MMTEREQVEQQIRDVLAAETTAIALSDKLFRPDGLFNRLAADEAERRSVSQSPLFREGLQRLSALQKQEAAQFSEAIRKAKGKLQPDGYLLKLERQPATS